MARIPNIIPDEVTRAKYLRHWRSGDLWQTPEKFPRLTAEALFGRPGNLHLEIGSGSGEYLVGEAEANPDELFLGIEASRRAAFYAVESARQKSLENILFIRANFKMLYPLLASNAFSRVALLFADPNYGTKYEKDRIFDADFLDAMASSLTTDGEIRVVTDEEPFFLDMLALAENDPRFVKTHAERYLEDFEPQVKTRFQIAWERKGKPIYRFELKKAG
jgi:tRNA (guanine-N7-)-methyltransferase